MCCRQQLASPGTFTWNHLGQVHLVKDLDASIRRRGFVFMNVDASALIHCISHWFFNRVS